MPPFDLPYQPAWQRETLTLLHFLWQGLLVAVVLVLVLWLLRVRRARARYALSLLAMLLMTVCPVVTFLVLEGAPEEAAFLDGMPPAATANHLAGGNVPPPDTEPPPVESAQEAETTSARQPARSGNLPAWSQAAVDFVRAHQSYLLVGWSVGVFLLSVRLLLSVIGLYWVRGGRRPIPAELASCAARLCERLRLRFAPVVLASERIREGLVVGFVRPVVLLPTAWLTEMTPEVLEAVIAHELAHIRRWDLWVNVFQRIVETLLFYHPAVWWLSRRVRLEREMCCDELAVAATGRRGVYVDALELMARKRFVPAKPALASTIGGSKMILLNRIRYIAGFSPTHDRARWWPVGLVTLLVPLAMWLASTSIAQPGFGEARGEEEDESRPANRDVDDERPAAGAGKLLRTFQEPRPAPDTRFGYSIAAVGNNLLVGAHGRDTPAEDAGVAYLFDGTTGRLLLTFPNPTPAENDWFGHCVAAVGSNVVIGAPVKSKAGEFAGAAYLFDGTTGKLLQTFRNPAPAGSDFFGRALAAADNKVLIGARCDDPPVGQAGAAYLFDATTGKLLQTFKKPKGTAGPKLYWVIACVAMLGNDVLIGAPEDDTGAEDAGAVYLFDGSTGKLVRTFLNPAPAADEYFGNYVATFGNNVLVTAFLDNTSAPLAGAAYLFDGASGKLLQTYQNPSPGLEDSGWRGDAFGRCVVPVGNNVLVGATLVDVGAHNAGAAYLFNGKTGKLLQTFRAPTPAENDRFGVSIAALGNNVLIAAYAPYSDDPKAGAVYLFKGVAKPPAGDAE